MNGMRLAGQRGLDQRQHGRDAAACRERHIVLSMERIERREEAPLGRHRLERRPGLQFAIGIGGERPAGDRLDRHPELAIVRTRADRIRAAHVLAAEHCAQVEVLALRKAECVAQRGRHFERNRHAISGLAADFAHAQRMEMGRHGRRVTAA